MIQKLSENGDFLTFFAEFSGSFLYIRNGINTVVMAKETIIGRKAEKEHIPEHEITSSGTPGPIPQQCNYLRKGKDQFSRHGNVGMYCSYRRYPEHPPMRCGNARTF